MTDHHSDDPKENQGSDNNQPDETETEDFETLFESYMGEMSPEVRVGEKISGEIIVIGQDNVFLNTGRDRKSVV